jgi:hypothetical protein
MLQGIKCKSSCMQLTHHAAYSIPLTLCQLLCTAVHVHMQPCSSMPIRSKKARAFEQTNLPHALVLSDVSITALLRVDWRSRCSQLQNAIAAAEGHVNTQQAKRLRRELQAYVSTADAARHLSTALEKQPCGAAALRSALARLEDASNGLPSAANAMIPAKLKMLSTLIADAKARLEVERAAEALAKEARTARSVEHLSRLEAVLLTARKVQADVVHPEAYATVVELRERLSYASKVRTDMLTWRSQPVLNPCVLDYDIHVFR